MRAFCRYASREEIEQELQNKKNVLPHIRRVLVAGAKKRGIYEK
jgi:hypothetical protein